ncbi:MAG: hypothetical protein ABI972_21075 [Acidobacteriota bacterium]
MFNRDFSVRTAMEKRARAEVLSLKISAGTLSQRPRRKYGDNGTPHSGGLSERVHAEFLV